MMIILKHLLCWLCKSIRKTRVLALASSCFITVLLFSQVVLPPAIPKGSKVVWPEFSLHLPFVEPKLSSRDRSIYLAVAVNSASTGRKHRELRKTIRETWGNSSMENRNKTWKLFFVLGISNNELEHKMNLQEAARNNDIIIGNFTDNYKNIILKTFMSHYWVNSKFPSCKYVLKTDDDIYARVPRLLQWLEQAGAPHRFYGGYVDLGKRTVRDPNSKWFLTKKQYEKEYWPPFCLGAFHVLSTDILPQIFNYTKFGRKPFHTDDAYIGVAAYELGIEVIKIPGFKLQRYEESRFRPRSACDLITSTTIGHLIDASTMIRYHNFFTKERKTAKYKWLRCLASITTSPKLFSIYSLVMFSLIIGALFRVILLS